MSIRFGRWELRPDNCGNWSLWQLRASKDGVPKWLPCKRYFQWNVIGNAFIYAANEELLEKNTTDALTFQDYADELRRLLDGFLEEARRTIEKEPK